MNRLKIGTVMEEIQYRLERLGKIQPMLQKRKVVIYGIGLNAKRVLDCLETVPVVGLMDSKTIGEFHYGKKVLSETEIKLLQVDTILIAAEPAVTEIVYERILPFCLQNQISILDMYGCDEMFMHRVIKEQELNYASVTEEILKQKIRNAQALFFSFEDVLCTQMFSIEEIYGFVEKEAEEKGIRIDNFRRNRVLAQEKMPFGMKCSLEDTYVLLSTLVDVGKEQTARLIEIEREIYLRYLKPRKDMTKLLQYAEELGKEIFIFSYTIGDEKILQKYISNLGISGCDVIAADAEFPDAFIGRVIHAVSQMDGYENILFIGNDQNNNLIIPQLYGADVQLIEGCRTMFWNYGLYGDRRKELEQQADFYKMAEVIEDGYNSPFLSEAAQESCNRKIAEYIGWKEEETGNKHLELFSIKQCEETDIEKEKLIFQRREEPEVSIIIPAYNQFAYTYNCLRSILRNSGDVNYEVILADDCSSDQTKTIENYVEGIQVIHNSENMLFLRNCNQAVKYAKGNYLLFLNNDTQVQVNWLKPLISLIESSDDIGMVGSKMIYPDGRLQEAGGIIWNDAGGCNYGRGKNPDAPEFNYVREVDYISGASIMLSRTLWDEIGGFDERYAPAYCEDSDLAFEIRKRGKKVLYQPKSEVVHFEGISNGTDVESGIKKYQIKNRDKMFQKWKNVLIKEQYPSGKNLLSASERKGRRKTILFISDRVPIYDKDAGSRTLYFYILEFLRRGYLIKFIPNNFERKEPYTDRLQQTGVEVIYGNYYRHNIKKWLAGCHDEIDYAFLSYPTAAFEYIDLLNELKIPVRYYGMDLHYLRNQREYDLLGDEKKLKAAQDFYKKEKYLIEKCEVVYYPSQIEVEIVKKEFHKNTVRQLMVYMYDQEDIGRRLYDPDTREGMLFVGGYRHAPNVDAVLWFAEKIFPAIYEKLKVPFYVVGADAPDEVKNIKVPGVEILGGISDQELEEMYRRVKLAVVPLRYGAGVKGKIIEAMYQRIPVVTTKIGAEGIPDEQNALITADDEKDFVKTVCEVYRDHQELKRISEIYKKLITKYYSREAAWNNIRDDFV